MNDGDYHYMIVVGVEILRIFWYCTEIPGYQPCGSTDENRALSLQWVHRQNRVRSNFHRSGAGSSCALRWRDTSGSQDPRFW